MKEQLTNVLLGVIALTLIVNTYYTANNGGGKAVAKPISNVAATPSTPAATPTPEPPKPQLPATTIDFAEYEHDFGNVKQDSKNKKVFTFTNTGDEPLVIETAKGSCGCTVPNYPKEPIAPGETGDIEVVYSPGKQRNAQTKTVTLIANTEPKQTVLKISAFVEADENAPADAAAPIQLGN